MTTPAIRCGTRSRSHSDVLARAAKIGAGLRALGLGPGDRVAVVLRNEIEFVEVSIGIARLGAVPVPVNWHWKGAELGYLLTDSGAKAAFVHTDLMPVVREAMRTPISLIEVKPTDTLREAYQLGTGTGPAGDLELESWIAAQAESIETPGVAPMSVIYTSGTTGQPKGILRHPVVEPEQRAAVSERMMLALALKPGMPTLVPAPLYHSAPNLHALFATLAGCDLTILPRFSAREFLSTVEQNRVAHAQAVPTMFVRLLQLPESERLAYDVSSLVAVSHAAAPCPPEVKRRMIEWWGPILWEYYGASETGAIVYCDSKEWLAHPGTVGRRMPGCDLKILLPDGSEAPTGTAGEVFLHPGEGWPDFTYIGNDAKRRAMEREGYLTVGDGGRLDEDGFLYLTDRLNDMVISGGVNIYPAEIEQFLITLPGVRDVAVFGIPDTDLGEALAAHVDTDPESGLTEDAIRAHVRSNLAGYKVPKVVVLDRELPREETGKLFKRRIRATYWRDSETLVPS